jgi:hypothetical protein
MITEGKISPEEAVRAYHGVLQGKGIKPHRSLEEDLKTTGQAMSYDGGATSRSTAEIRKNPIATAKSNSPGKEKIAADWPKRANGAPDFERMNSAQRLAYDAARLK